MKTSFSFWDVGGHFYIFLGGSCAFGRFTKLLIREVGFYVTLQVLLLFYRYGGLPGRYSPGIPVLVLFTSRGQGFSTYLRTCVSTRGTLVFGMRRVAVAVRVLMRVFRSERIVGTVLVVCVVTRFYILVPQGNGFVN